MEEVDKLVGMISQKNRAERIRKQIWLRELRERTQYRSIILRPQTVRAMWMRYSHKDDASVLIKRQ